MDNIWNIIVKADKKWVITSILMGFTAIVARGLRWSNLLEPMGYFPKKWNNIHAVSLSYFVSMAIPRSGELVRCTAINQVEDIPVDKLFGTVILERVIDTSILLLFVGLAFLLNYDVFSSLIERVSAETGTSSEPGTGSLIFWLCGVVISAGIAIIAFRKKILASKIGQKISDFLLGMKEGFSSILKMKKRWQFVFYSVIIWGMYYLSMLVMLKALHLEPFGWNEALFLVVAGGLGVIIPTPNGLGSYHFLVQHGVIVLASTYAVWPEISDAAISERGAALATLQWSAQTGMMIIAGLVATIAFALQRKKLNVKPQ